MKVNVVNRKVIKPCTPTPPNLRTYKISMFDELNEAMHVIRILYFASSYDNINTININNGVKMVLSLEESLAKVLPLFYPLAGRYVKEKRLVDCNDEGAEYVEAEVLGVDLVQLVNGEVATDQLNKLLPLEIGATDEVTDPMLGVQINRFRCGGVAIGVCASHRVFDSASLGIFLQAWAATALKGETEIHPDFTSSSLFPAENIPPFDLGTEPDGDDPIIVRRFVFGSHSISRLRDNFRPNWRSSCTDKDRPPSRVVVVSAFLTQALLRTDRLKNKKSRPSLIAQAINIRERTIPPIPKHAIGTWVSSIFIEYTANDSENLENDFPGVVKKMRKITLKAIKDCEKIVTDKEFARSIMIDNNLDAAKKTYSGEYKVIWMTDWCKFGEYELDFGFGKPVWVSLADVPVPDLCILMNNKENDGIEAWVYLRESDMDYFEKDEDVKTLTNVLRSGEVIKKI